MSERELTEPHKDNKRYTQRNDEGKFEGGFKSLSKDVKQRAQEHEAT